MKVAIIGAGFTGLSAAIDLSQAGHQVTIFERSTSPGGLAAGFKDPSWDWTLEQHYHHVFTSDSSILSLAKKIGHPIDFLFPKTSIYYHGVISRFDSPSSLLKFPFLNLVDKLRTAFGLAFLIIDPIWKPLEKITAKKFITFIFGQSSWEVLWQPLFDGKFGKYSPSISAAWFWARIHKRSSSLGYPRGGFQSLLDSVVSFAKKNKVKINFSTNIAFAIYSNGQWQLTSDKGKTYSFSKVICTLPTPQFIKIFPDLPADYLTQLHQLSGLAATNLVISLSKPFFTDRTYWLNVNDRQLPFLAVVEHTHFISPQHYANQNLLYVGNYLPIEDKNYQLSPQKLLHLYWPYLHQISPHIKKSDIKKIWLWKAPFAQPIVTRNYSKKIPQIHTPLPGLYLANIQQVYPYDRGTNYAVQLGERASKICQKN